MSEIIILGAGGHAKVLADIAVKSGYTVKGFLDDNCTENKLILGFPVLGPIEHIGRYQNHCKFAIGIGANDLRQALDLKYAVDWATLIHPTATIGLGAQIGKGSVLCAHSAVGVSSKIGRHCILNTGAIADHDNFIDDYAHISVNAIAGGTVSVGKRTFVGIGASIRNNLSIAADCVIGAGAAVVADIKEKGTYAGIPARRL